MSSRRPPSERDQFIYAQVKVRCRPQKVLAGEIGVSQSRVSQIVRRVEHWFGDCPAEERGELSPNAQRRVERRLEAARQDFLYELYVRKAEEMDAGPAVTKRTREKNGEVLFEERTERDQRSVQLQALKAAQRAVEARGKIFERKPLPQPPPRAADDKELERATFEYLAKRREEAERAGRVQSSGEFGFYHVVHDAVKALCGEPVMAYAANTLAPGSPHWEVSQRIVGWIPGTGENAQVLKCQHTTTDSPCDERYGDASCCGDDSCGESSAAIADANQSPQGAKKVGELRAPAGDALGHGEYALAPGTRPGTHPGTRALAGDSDAFTDDPVGRLYERMTREYHARLREARRMGLRELPPTPQEKAEHCERVRAYLKTLRTTVTERV